MAIEESKIVRFPNGAQDVPFEDVNYVMAAGPDGKFKRISKNALKNGLTIENGRIQAVDPGPLPTQPTGQTRYMKVTAVGTWTYGGSPVGSNAEGFETTFFWDGDTETWSQPEDSVRVKGDPGANGKTTEPFNPSKVGGYTAGDIIIENSKLYQVKAGQSLSTGQAPSANLTKVDLIPLGSMGLDEIKILPQGSPNFGGGWFYTNSQFLTKGSYLIKVFNDANIEVVKNGSQIIVGKTLGGGYKYTYFELLEDSTLTIYIHKDNTDCVIYSGLFLDVFGNKDRVDKIVELLKTDEGGVQMTLTAGGAMQPNGAIYSNPNIRQSQLIKVEPGQTYRYFGAFGATFGVVGFSNIGLASPTAIVTADFLGVDGLTGNSGVNFVIPSGVEYIYYSAWSNLSPVMRLVNLEGGGEFLGKPLLKGESEYYSNDFEKARPTIGQPASNYKPTVSIYGGFIADSPNGEHELINSGSAGQAATSTAVRGNVLAVRHTNPNGSSAVRFLRAEDGGEVGAVGHQNGDGTLGSFILFNSTFLSASFPYTGNNSGPTEEPPKLILSQEGLFSGGNPDYASARFMCERNWNMGFYAPFNYSNPYIYMPSTSFNVLIGTKTDNGSNRLQVNGSAANSTGVWVTLSDERLKTDIKEISNPIEKVKAVASATRTYIKDGEKRTGYIAQLLKNVGFEGHITYNIPENEEIGANFGWEYEDETIVTKTHLKEPKSSIIEVDGKQLIVHEKDENGCVIMVNILDENGEPKFVENKEVRRVVKKEGEMILGIENNFTPYLFPAFVELLKRVEELEAKLKN